MLTRWWLIILSLENNQEIGVFLNLYSNLTNFNTAINNAVEAGEIKPSDRPNYFTAGSDLLDCGLYISGRFNIINISGWFTVNRASNNAFDTSIYSHWISNIMEEYTLYA